MSKVKFSDGAYRHSRGKSSTPKNGGKGSFRFDIAASPGCSLTIHGETRKDAIKKAMSYMGEGFHVKQIG